MSTVLNSTYQSILGHMPGDEFVTGRSAAGLDRSRFWQFTTGMVRQVLTSCPHTDHLPRLLAFPTSHRALTNTHNKASVFPVTQTLLHILSHSSRASI